MKILRQHATTTVLGLLVAASGCCQTAGAADSELALQAYDALCRGQYQKTMNFASIALRQNSSDGLAYLCRARAEMYFEKNASAAKDFDRGLALVKDVEDGMLLNAAKCYAGQQDDEKALNLYNRLLKTNVTALGLRDRADLLWKMNRHKEAFADFEKAAKFAPKEFWIYQDLADCYMQEKRYPEAMKNADRMIQLRPNEPRGYVARAKIYEKTGKPDLASKDLHHADELGRALF